MVRSEHRVLLLVRLATAGTHSLSDITTNRTGICLCALSARRKLFGMTRPTIRLDLFKALDTRSYLALEITFEGKRFHSLANLYFFVRSQLFGARAVLDPKLVEDLLGTWTTNAIHGRETYFQSLFIWDGYT